MASDDQRSESDLCCFICFNNHLTLPAESQSKQCGEIKQIKERENELNLKETLRKIFQYLLIPAKDFKKVYYSLKSQPSFCTDCSNSLQQIVEIQKKVTALELLIQHKVETLGKVIAATASKQKINTKEDKLLLKKFRKPVLLSYIKGILPTPSILLSRCKSLPSSTCRKYISNLKKENQLLFDSNSSISEDSESRSNLKRINKSTPSASSKTNSKRKYNSEKEKEKNNESNVPIGTKPPSSNLKLLQQKFNSEQSEEKTDESHRGKDYFECPICQYKLIIEESGKYHQGLKCNFARQRLQKHFNVHHNPVKRKDLSKEGEDGKEFYRCTLCPFSAYVNEGKTTLNNRRYGARLSLSRHYLATHYKFKRVNVLEKNQTKFTKDSKELLDNLVKGEDYLNCPKEDCSFVEILTNIRNYQDHEKKIYKLTCAISNHYLRTHERKNDLIKNSNRESYPCLIQTENGRHGFKCPKCNFLSSFDYQEDKEARQVRRNNFKSLLRHYLSHLEVKIQGDRHRVRSVKCEEGQCGFVCKISKDFMYPLKYPSERGKKLKQLRKKITKHYQEEHPDKPIPEFQNLTKNTQKVTKIKQELDWKETFISKARECEYEDEERIKFESESWIEDEFVEADG